MAAVDNLAERVVALEKELKRERQYSADLLRSLNRRDERLTEVESGWHVVYQDDWMGPYKSKDEALKIAEDYAGGEEGTHSALAVYVEARFDPQEIVDMDAYNGVQRGVDYPYTM